MEKTDFSCLAILFCALRYHRNESELGSTLQLASCFTLTCILKQLSTCYVAGATLGRTCSCTPTPRTREGIGLAEHEALPTILLYARKGWNHHEHFSEKNCTPHEQLESFETRAWGRLYVFFKFPAFGNINQFRFHWAVNLDPYRVLPISLFTMYNNRKAYFY